MAVVDDAINDERSDNPQARQQHRRQISGDCFHLVSLKQKVQND